MKLLRKSSQKYQLGIKTYLLACCLFLILLSAALAKSNGKGKGIGIDNPHANPHATSLHVNPHANPRVNPAGIITGTGGTSAGSPATNQRGALISHEVTNIGAPKKHFVVKDGGSMFLGMSGSNVLVQIGAPSGTISLGKANKNGQICLGAGDSFSSAIGNLDSLTITLEVPNPIGAKGSNPIHGGQHPNKGDGNPGGGNGKGGWGQGNNGNGLGNIWTGNQGRGVGEGMAGGTHNTPPEPPDPTEPPVPPGPPNNPPGPPNNPPGPPEPPVQPDPAPLYRLEDLPLEEEEFENGGCPALMNWLAAELGIEEKNLQISVANAFISSTNLEACEMAAGLINAAQSLNDPSGTSVAALEQVANEFLTEGAPVSEEQMTLIAAALADHTGDGTYYAAAGQWLDALVKYVSLLVNDMGFSAEDATALVMDKYGASISDDASLLVAYIEANLLAD
ncbi:MAG: hypothetical protein ACYSWZ_02340 [Planctomycetota bacterium]|jgi:hypothetical protein